MKATETTATVTPGPSEWWRSYEYPLTPEELEGILVAGGIDNWALHIVMHHNSVPAPYNPDGLPWFVATPMVVVGFLLGVLIGIG